MPKLPQKLPNIEINLLPKDPFIDSLLGKFLTWSLTIGRYIVVLTELIVIISFLSRFQLDRQLTDVNEAIEAQKSIILSYQDTESKFLIAQTKIDFMNKELQRGTLLEPLTYLEKNLPVDVRLDTLSLTPTGWVIKASALSAQGMKAAVDKIVSANPKSEVSVSTVKLNSRFGTIEFDVNVKQEQKVVKAASAPAQPTESIE